MAAAEWPGYRFTFRPAEAGHGYPVLVFDAQGRLDLALTFFARAATRQLSASSVRVYLYALLPFFDFLARATRPSDASSLWNTDSARVRQAVADYIEDQLGCVIRRHRLGFELVTVTGRSRSNVGVPRRREVVLRRHAADWLLLGG